jgi:hypothetical protein
MGYGQDFGREPREVSGGAEDDMAYLRSQLYKGDKAWTDSSESLEKNNLQGLTKPESKI